MIKNFEQEPQPLTEYEEKTLLPILIQGLQAKKGKSNAVTNRTIVVRLNACGYKIDAPRCRKIINHIRTNDLIPGLIATSGGYFIAENVDELIDYEESLKGREDAIKSVRMALARQRQILYGDKQPASII